MSGPRPTILAGEVAAPLPAVAPDAPLAAALRAMEEQELPGVLVVDRAGRCIGVVSRAADRTSALEPAFYRDGPWRELHEAARGALVGDVLSTVLIAVPPATPVSRLAALLLRLDVDRVLVAGASGPPAVVETFDLLRLVAARRLLSGRPEAPLCDGPD